VTTKTLIFNSVLEPFSVVLTFNLVDYSGRVTVTFSVLPHTPQPVYSILRVQAVWQSFVSSIVDGSFPPLPKGWRVQDGGNDADTSLPPDHFH
jgi:hypothetical protein